MTPILAKHAALGRLDSVNEMLRFMDMGIPPINTFDDVIGLGRRILGECGALASPSTLACVQRYLDTLSEHHSTPKAVPGL